MWTSTILPERHNFWKFTRSRFYGKCFLHRRLQIQWWEVVESVQMFRPTSMVSYSDRMHWYNTFLYKKCKCMYNSQNVLILFSHWNICSCNMPSCYTNWTWISQWYASHFWFRYFVHMWFKLLVPRWHDIETYGLLNRSHLVSYNPRLRR